LAQARTHWIDGYSSGEQFLAPSPALESLAAI